MTDRKTRIIYEEATPLDMSDAQRRCLVKSRIKNPAWTLGFCLASDHIGLLQLGELFATTDREEDAFVTALSLFIDDEMVVISMPVPGVPEGDVEHYLGEVFGTDDTWRFPSQIEEHSRIVCASPKDHARLYQLFFADLLSNAAEVN